MKLSEDIKERSVMFRQAFGDPRVFDWDVDKNTGRVVAWRVNNQPRKVSGRTLKEVLSKL